MRLPAPRSRRQFLQQLAAAAAATRAVGEPRLLADERGQPGEHPEPRADACILLWMAGGMAAPDTLDPKTYQPFRVGLPVEKVASTFPAIDTAVDDIKICSGLEGIASVMDRGALIRSHYLPDLGHILHSRHQYHWHTGYVPPQTVACPHIGAWMAKVLGPRNPVMPAFVNIGQRLEGLGENEEIKAFTTAGFFGSEFAPLNLPYPDRAARAVRPPDGMTPGRFANRYKFFRQLVDRSPHRRQLSDHHQQSMLQALDRAQRLLQAPERKAFDIHEEPLASREKYGSSRFGQGCLLARRLVESGARFVEVSTEYIPFLHWDTHNDGHTTMDRLHKEIDGPVTQLILDLEARGMLDRTLVVLASEFSRDMIVEGVPGSKARDQSRAKTDVLRELRQYGLHRHFTGAASVLMFGGGVRRGLLYGASAPSGRLWRPETRSRCPTCTRRSSPRWESARERLTKWSAARSTPPKTAPAARP